MDHLFGDDPDTRVEKCKRSGNGSSPPAARCNSGNEMQEQRGFGIAGKLTGEMHSQAEFAEAMQI